MTRDELRARFLAMHDASRVARAEEAALFALALAVYQGSVARRERAQEALLAASEAETEWCAIVHGLALQYARRVDREDSPALAAQSLSSPDDDNQ